MKEIRVILKVADGYDVVSAFSPKYFETAQELIADYTKTGKNFSVEFS